MSASVPEKMKAVQLVKYKTVYELRETSLPSVGDNDLLIRVHATGYCHTDYQVWEGVYKSPTPLVPSHEPVGEIVAMGAHAKKAGLWALGQRVGILLFRHACGTCVNCRATDATDTIKSWSGRDGLAAVIVCTDDVGISKWSLTTLRPQGVAVPLGLPPSGFSFDAFDLVFNEITIKGSLVSNRVQAEDMLQTVARHGIKSHLKVLTLTDGPRLPDLYMVKHLRGRLVMKIA